MPNIEQDPITKEEKYSFDEILQGDYINEYNTAVTCVIEGFEPLIEIKKSQGEWPLIIRPFAERHPGVKTAPEQDETIRSLDELAIRANEILKNEPFDKKAFYEIVWDVYKITGNSIENIEDIRYSQFGKYTEDCPQWLLDKISVIERKSIDEEYIKKILEVIRDEFDSKKNTTTITNDIVESRFISVSEILERRQRSCGSMASVVASVLRNLGIPTKLVHGRFVKNRPGMYHAWNEVRINHGWKSFDTTQVDGSYNIGEFHKKILETVDWEEIEDQIRKQ
jgi:transglutaminase/protease-like cytokinesis protein 3